jgi:hypothetical protein
VFTRFGSTWTRQAGPLTPRVGGVDDNGNFGVSVALSSNGSTALVGDNGHGSSVGVAWVFSRSGATFARDGRILAGVGESGPGMFGVSGALSWDGSTALIGANGDSQHVGAAWVFG